MSVIVSQSPHPARVDAWIERAGIACVLLLPVAMLHGRGVADILICSIDALFLARCARAASWGGGWGWTRQAWVPVAAAWFLWLTLCSALAGEAKPLAQALVSIRLLLLVVACQCWALADVRVQRWLVLVFAGCTAWIAIESWQQLLIGTNLFGFTKAADGIITGPFGKERAGQIYLDVIFPGVLPFVLRRLDLPSAKDRLAGLAMLAAAAATMVLIGQRMPVLLLLLGLVSLGVLVRRLRLTVAVTLGVCILMGALLPLISPPIFERLVVHFLAQMRHFWVSDYGQIYVRALVMLTDHPWFGLGYDGFRNHCMDPAYFHGLAAVGVTDAQIIAGEGCNIHPHNHWLEVATSAGLPGLALFAALVGLWLHGMARRGPGADPALHTALVVAAIVLLWPLAARSSLFVVDAGGWAFLIAGWGLAAARPARFAADPSH